MAIPIMGLLIVGAALYWYFRMGGQQTVQGLIGGSGGGGGSTPVVTADANKGLNINLPTGGNINQAFTDKNGNNVSIQRNVNSSGSPGVQQHGSLQQTSNINGVVKTNTKTFYTTSGGRRVFL